MTNTVRTAIAAVCAVLLAGCVSAPAYQPAPIAIAESTHGFKSVPVLGVTGTVETGETFYSESRVTSTQRYTATLLQPVKASMELGHSLVLDAGRSGALSKTVFGNRKALCWDFVTQAGVGGPAHACVVDSKDSGVFDQAMFKNRDRMFPIDMPARYEVTKLPEQVLLPAW